MYKYKLSNIAKDDLIQIYQFGGQRFGTKQAEIYFDSFFTHFEIIAKNPYLFEAVDFIKPGYRRCVCGVDSIYFKINAEEIEIMTIIGRQELNNK
ncbi:MAG: type II toxin-antitoxin system RelE/ParE family toxin [Crocinitomicaceae bacterium]|jgi:toxin ParE1/3/4|nr:type II toxin-antitoxin system RelE/ParE family toxin [Crocinitomicaceae bacterium]MDP4806527.1 type II toxin-antitoxin system RelE/ParE family toxin [Crocinitomicaceae bacterium]